MKRRAPDTLEPRASSPLRQGSLPGEASPPLEDDGKSGDARHSRLRELLGSDELGWLLTRLRAKLERGEPLVGSVTLRRASREQRAAVDRLLGRPPSRGDSLGVSLESLADLLRRADLCRDLSQAVEALVGPVADQRALACARDTDWQRVFAELDEGLRSRTDLHAWRSELERTGLLKRLCEGDPERGRRLAAGVLAVVRRLPSGGSSLAELAAAAAGDSHALDPGAPLATLALRAAAGLAGLPVATNAEERRDIWAAVGVLCDELSAPVLVLNLHPSVRDSLTDQTLALHAERGEPARLTLRQLLREPPHFSGCAEQAVVSVCENPAIVAAAANRLGHRSAPLVCIEGQPTSASHRLLTLLRDAGMRLRYHGDFDWGGLRIANALLARHHASPWRMAAADYLAEADGGAPLRGQRVEASWDGDLAEAMASRGKAVHEEQVVPSLLEDLAHST